MKLRKFCQGIRCYILGKNGRDVIRVDIKFRLQNITIHTHARQRIDISLLTEINKKIDPLNRKTVETIPQHP